MKCESFITFVCARSVLQTCLRESDDSEEEDSLSDRSEDRFSEGSWDRVERKDTEVSVPECLLQVPPPLPSFLTRRFSLTNGMCVHLGGEHTAILTVGLPLAPPPQVTRWVPDHMASHCFSCDCEFWIAKRRHHCRCVC